METAGSVRDIQKAATDRKRPVFVFPVPDELVSEEIQSSFGLVKLRPDEELQAARRSGGDSYRLAWELCRASLIEIDDRRLNVGEGEDERIWRNMDPVLRQIILAAYGDIHNPEDDLIKKCLGSKKVIVK